MTTTTRFLLTLLLGTVTSVASAETIGDALAKCKRIDNSLERLICYDDVVANIRGMQGVSSEVSSVAVPVAKQTASSSVAAAASTAKSTSAAVADRSSGDVARQQSAAPASDFGLQKKREAESDGVAATIVSVSKTALGKYKMTLDNGMVWQQTDSTIFLPREGDTVTVERGMLGSFYLSKNDLNKTVKVKRIK